MLRAFVGSQFSGYILIGLVAALIGGYFWVKRTGYLECKQDVIIKQVTIAGKRNEIANNRPDDAAFFDGLRNNPDW